ncbi:hypothetical protein ACFOTA_17595 [Chitinophaga sp. GCM10012297]|uniref:Lipocalin-like domain-containing protein n=1 Tax=Chitinophaga chungangae TaxID=2821488 RepID=A0ABS3YH65_9BACT|nr:hypothetical protein [Chitinophaga chungangae]MBO9154037.1 hypothetical protein [Chitinophaga chungangae]
MTKRWSLYLPLLLATALFSCKEESIEPAPVPPAGALTGEYDFVSMSLDAVTTSESVQAGMINKAVSKVIYTTKNNQGTYTFDGKNIIGTNVSYSVDTTLKTLFYFGDPEPEEIDMPFQADIPAYNSSGTYRVIGTDSLFFEGGFINGPVSSGGQPMTSPASGGKFSFSGKMLIFTAKVSHVTTTSIMGITTTSSTFGSTTVRMRKRD